MKLRQFPHQLAAAVEESRLHRRGKIALAGKIAAAHDGNIDAVLLADQFPQGSAGGFHGKAGIRVRGNAVIGAASGGGIFIAKFFCQLFICKGLLQYAVFDQIIPVIFAGASLRVKESCAQGIGASVHIEGEFFVKKLLPQFSIEKGSAVAQRIKATLGITG